mgnify:CR=1 FL=1
MSKKLDNHLTICYNFSDNYDKDNYVLPAGYYNYTKPFWDEMKKDIKSDMTPMSHILNGVARPPQTAKTNKYNYTNTIIPYISKKKQMFFNILWNFFCLK